MKQEFVRNPYNYDSDKLSTDTGLHCKDESLTEQEHLEECDINYIAERFMKTGMAPQVVNMPTYGDFSGIFDFQTAMNVITQAKQEFMSLPAKIRTRFNNDPQELVAFFEDPTNKDEAIRLGFINKPQLDNQDNQEVRRETTQQEEREHRSRDEDKTPTARARTDAKKSKDADPS